VIARVLAALALLAAVLALAGCESNVTVPVATAPAAAPPGADEPPPAPREFRGAWVATVSNIDWPSQPGLSADAQRAEALAILDRARAIGLNALILQVRPAGDAIYPSALEPWSEYLGGAQGRPPAPAYDPLAFWVAQAHLRGLELHAWFNPYRARHSSARTPLVAPHLALRRPDLVVRYGDQLWMDPGAPEAAANTLAVVADVVRRYDIDGVQIDDYFYPYPVSVDGVEQPFPDDASYARYRAAGGALARDDWRRSNVDGLVQALNRTVHEIKPWVRFGVSPFGLGRPDRRPPGVTGFSQYDKLYADVERWLANGWLDYLAPQLYWPIASEGQPFAALLAYWVQADTAGRAIWPGLFTSQVGRNWKAQELLDQVALVQAPGSGASGQIHFSISALMDDREGLATRLRQGPYAQPALVPAMPWLGAAPPAAPRLLRSGARVRIEPVAGSAVARWAVWRRAAGIDAPWRFSVLPAQERIIDLATDRALVVSAVGRTGQLSARAILRLP
jgi:uncharacterized lipoprotein YddW (UPF0748 family)